MLVLRPSAPTSTGMRLARRLFSRLSTVPRFTWVKSGAWALLAVVVVAGFASLAATPMSAGSPSTGGVVVTDTLAGTGAAPGPVIESASSIPRPAIYGDAYTAAYAKGTATAWEGSGTPQTLPAWRWSSVTLDRDLDGLGDVVINGPVWLIGNLLLQLANLLWAILLWIMRVALSSGDILMRASYPIDWAFAWLSSYVIAFAAIFLAIALFRIFKKLITLEWISMLRTIIVFVALFAGMNYVAGQSAQALKDFPSDSIDDQQGRLSVVGTMPWLANEVADMGSKVISPISDQVVGITSSNGMIGGGLPDGAKSAAEQTGVEGEFAGAAPPQEMKPEEEGAATPSPFNDEGMPVTCAAYINQLEAIYARSPEANRSLVVVSNLWLNSFYANWMATQYGAPVSGYDSYPARAMCHYAELTNDIPAEQQQVTVAGLGAKVNRQSKVLDPSAKGDDQRRAVTAWVACAWDADSASWVTNPEFDGIWGTRIDANDGQGAFHGDQSCQNMFTNPDASWYSGWMRTLAEVSTPVGGVEVGVSTVAPEDDPYLIFGDSLGPAINGTGGGGCSFGLNPVEVATGCAGAALGAATDLAQDAAEKVVEGATGAEIEKKDPESMDNFDRTKLQGIAAWGEAASGLNHGDRVLYPLINLLVAAMFLFSLGAVAVGLLFSQLLLILCLMFAIPAAVVMYALGMPRATALVRLTAASMLSQLLFTLLLTAMILVTGLFQSLLVAISLPWGITTILFGIAPLAAFYLIRAMLKRIGMGDIMTASGALSFATSATLRATGDRQLAAMGTAGADGKSAVQNGLSKIPLLGKGVDKFDKTAAPTWSNWGPRISMTTDARRERAQKKAQKKAGATDKQRRARRNNEFLRNKMRSRGDGKIAATANKLDSLLLRDSKGRQQHVGRAIDFSKDMGKKGALNGAAWAAFAAIYMGNPDGAHKAKDWIRSKSRSSSWRAQALPVDSGEDTPDPIELVTQRRISGKDAQEASEQNAQQFNAAIAANPGLDAINEAVDTILYKASLAHVGAESAGDILTPGQQDHLVEQYAAKTGYAVEDILSTPTGIVGPMPMSNAQRRQASLDMLRDFEHWLPEDERIPLQDESPAEFRARLEVIGRARGGILEDGTRVDMLAARGIDVSDARVQEEFVRFQNGDGNTRFDRLEIVQTSNFETRVAERAAATMFAATGDQVDMAAAIADATAMRVNETIAALGASTSELKGALEGLASRQERIGDLEAQLARARDQGNERQIQKLASLITENQYDMAEKLQRGQTELAGTLAQHMDTAMAGILALQLDPDSARKLTDTLADTLDGIQGEFEKLTSQISSGVANGDDILARTRELIVNLDQSRDTSMKLATDAVEMMRDHLNKTEEHAAEMRRRSARRNQEQSRRQSSDSYHDERVDAGYSMGGPLY